MLMLRFHIPWLWNSLFVTLWKVCIHLTALCYPATHSIMNQAYFCSIRVRKAWEVGRMMCSLPTFSPSSRSCGSALFCLLHISLNLCKLFSPALPYGHVPAEIVPEIMYSTSIWTPKMFACAQEVTEIQNQWLQRQSRTSFDVCNSPRGRRKRELWTPSSHVVISFFLLLAIQKWGHTSFDTPNRTKNPLLLTSSDGVYLSGALSRTDKSILGWKEGLLISCLLLVEMA